MMSVNPESKSAAGIPLTQQIVEQVAATKSTSALDLTPLYTVIDPEALETIFSKRAQTGQIEFEYEGCSVRVDGDGEITVSD